MAKTLRYADGTESDNLESLPECRLLMHFLNTPVQLIGGFNLLLADDADTLYLAHIENESLVLVGGKMPLAEADTSLLTRVTPKQAAKWYSKGWRQMQDRMDDADITALDTFLSILAKHL